MSVYDIEYYLKMASEDEKTKTYPVIGSVAPSLPANFAAPLKGARRPADVGTTLVESRREFLSKYETYIQQVEHEHSVVQNKFCVLAPCRQQCATLQPGVEELYKRVCFESNGDWRFIGRWQGQSYL